MFVNVYGQHILVRVFNLHIGLIIFSVCVKQWKGGIGGIGRCPHRKKRTLQDSRDDGQLQKVQWLFNIRAT